MTADVANSILAVFTVLGVGLLAFLFVLGLRYFFGYGVVPNRKVKVKHGTQH